MRIDYLNTKANAKPLQTDTAFMVRRHRDRQVHRGIIAAYRASHPLCERCMAEGRTSATAEIHHVHAVAEGGRTENANLLGLCLPCHTAIDAIPRALQFAMKQDNQGAAGGRPQSFPILIGDHP